jgi:hypothetical protein
MKDHKKFADLKTYAAKEFKFKQGVFISQVYNSHIIGDALYGRVKRGVCAALSCDWLAHQMIFENQLVNPTKYSDLSSNVWGPRVTAEAAQLQANYLDDPAARFAKLDTLARNFKICVVPTLSAHNAEKTALGEFLAGFDDLKPNEGLFIGEDFADASDEFCHAAALVRRKQTFLFFDPNIGVYKVPGGTAKSFFETYFSLYDASEGWKIKLVDTFIMQPVS